MTPTLARESIGSGMYFLTFEALVKREMDTRGIARKDVESSKLCLFGGLAGISMWLSVYPTDVIKSTMQTDNYKNFKYKTSLDAAKGIFKTHGIGGFFKGFTPTILRAAPVNAATFLAFEQAMRIMG
ncbi:unnamed protein product [Ambrosiozyma monospora]|uniref:Unnamed protein product n=1 Tax=Ambrosiozyma monospora TaxID=43982 RepID=A0ACB5TFG0_AMBMO|nr:unnamed protein product [Ambrosiozyma monospora]